MKRLLIAITLLIAPISAYAAEFGVGANVSTLGAGVEGQYKPWNWLGLRLGTNMANFETTANSSSTNYKYKIDFRSVGLVADIYPFSTGFRLSAGGRYDLNKIDYEARPDGCPESETPEECNTPEFLLQGASLASVEGKVRVNRFAPYAGFGYDGALVKSGRVRFAMDLGVLYQGDPKVTMQASSASQSPVAPPGNTFERQERDIAQDLQWMKFFPVVSVSLGYRF
ncbi:MAG: hypothetical protein ACPG06_00615 [Alphaproteobacteria bacterium]